MTLEMGRLGLFGLRRLDLGWWGEIRLPVDPPFDTLEYEPGGREPVVLSARDLFGRGRVLHYALAAEAGDLLLVGPRGTVVWHLDLTIQALTVVAITQRVDDWLNHSGTGDLAESLYDLRLHPIEDDLLVLHECGLLRIGQRGQLRWQQDHPYDAILRHLDEHTARYEAGDFTFKDDAGYWPGWSYRLTDGTRTIAPLS